MWFCLIKETLKGKTKNQKEQLMKDTRLANVVDSGSCDGQHWTRVCSSGQKLTLKKSKGNWGGSEKKNMSDRKKLQQKYKN